MEAWVRREMEQQDLLEEIHREIWDSVEQICKEESDEYRHFLAVADSLLHTLARDEGGLVALGTDLIANAAIRKIEKFARTPEEAKVLEIRLLEKLLASGFSRAHSNYLRQRVHEQGKLYEGRRAMDEVE